MKNEMINHYKSLIQELLSKINDEDKLHEIFVDMLVWIEKGEAGNGND